MPLRAKILLFTAVPLLALSGFSLWAVSQSVTRQAMLNLHQDLERAGLVFEQLLRARSGELALAGQALARDPRFLAAWDAADGADRATAAALQDFNAIHSLDLLDAYGPDGRLRASASADGASRASGAGLVRAALAGTPALGVLLRSDSPYQVAAVPVRRAGRPVGALLVGERLGQGVAQRLALLTRSQVTFVAQRVTRASTLEDPEDRYRLIQALRRGARRSGPRSAKVFEIEGAHQHYVTLARPFPGSEAGLSYALQRSVEEETLFLRRIHRSLVGLALLALLVSLAAGYLVARNITTPVLRLVRAAQEMERGNYEYPLDIRSHDEVGFLACSFAGMRRHLHNYVTGLEEVGRLKSEFLTLASHELRTPVTIIEGFQSLLAERVLGPLTDPQDGAVDAIGKGAKSLHRLAENATRLAEIDQEALELTLERIEMDAMLNQVILNAMSAAPQRKVHLAWRVEPGAERLTADSSRLYLALSNLVQNGVRFTPDGGRVETRARREGPNVLIEVEDTGVGIPSDDLEHIFEKSFAVRSSLGHHSSSDLEFGSGGLGLGLCITRGVVRAHGGDIRVHSVVGQGSLFTVVLPAERDEEADVPERAKAA
ncbi:MAG TPA: ATP-binding protein [Candidatus Saccharimonadales bacterium]|nr:ATP-binding protein [Candidatus Saccharimonadales bacterium]